jgi:glycyl-tRNA synthetase beta chain
MNELILELYSEEIPSFAQQPAAEGFSEIFTNFFNKQNIKFHQINSFCGPCRITLRITGLSFDAADENIRGPKKNSDANVLNGFCNKNKVNVDDLTVKEENGVEYYFLYKKNTNTLESLLLDNLSKLISSYVWPKSMRWNTYLINWIRPLRNILCLLNNQILPIEYGHIKANNLTFGHKFFAHKSLTINSWDEYQNNLLNAFVVLSKNERKSLISNQLEKICQDNTLALNQDAKLLDEISGLVEYPSVLVGDIPQQFMQLPQELLISCLRLHQKYFTCNDAAGKLANKFLFVCNSPLKDFNVIIDGNQKVLSARLADALYFYNQDLKHSLESRFESLQKIIFHSKLGTVKDKSLRLQSLCKYLKPDNQDLHLAAKLCKCDLLTEVVQEFPELQGIISKYYAANDNLNTNISQTVAKHYSPQGANDEVPEGDAAILSLADKIDSLVGLFLAGERATSSKDPYALRRNTISILRIIFSNKFEINLEEVFEYAASLYPIPQGKELLKELESFFIDRLKNMLSKEYDLKILNCLIKDDLKNLSQIELQAKKLSEFCKTENWNLLLGAYKRVVNILGKQTKAASVEPDIFNNPYELALFNQANAVASGNLRQDFIENLHELLPLVKTINEFFDNVFINDEIEQISRNRINLSYQIKELFDRYLCFRNFL